MKYKGEVTMKYLAILVLILVIPACNSDKTVNANGNGAGGPAIVEIKEMQYESFSHFFSANGSVEAVKEAFISPEISGQIHSILVNEGDRVRKGQTLATLNSSVTEKAIEEVKTQLEFALTVYDKRKGLWEKEIGSEIQFLEAKTAKESLEKRLKSLQAQLAMSEIAAPIDGIVDRIDSKIGELAVPGKQLLHLVNLEKLYVNADVSEAYIATLNTGDPVEVSFPSYPGLTVNTEIHRIGNVINAQNRTFKITLLIGNISEKLKPNLMAVISLKDFSTDQALVVPTIIIKKDMTGSYIYQAKNEKGKLVAEKLYIEPGISAGAETMVTKGIEPGQKIITQGYNLVKNGVEIRISEHAS